LTYVNPNGQATTWLNIAKAIGSLSRNYGNASQPALAGLPTNIASSKLGASVSSSLGSVSANTSGTISSLDDLASFDKVTIKNGILQAVPSDIHSQFTHRGGISKFVSK